MVYERADFGQRRYLDTNMAAPKAYEPETLLLFSTMVTPPSAARGALIDDLIARLKAAGVWAKLDALYLFAAADEQTALLNWVNPGTFTGVNNSATVFATDVGYTGDAVADYISSSCNITTAGLKYARDDATIFGYSNTSAQEAKAFLGTNSNLYIRCYPRYTDNKTYWRMNTATEVGFTNASASGAGLFSCSRTASNAYEVYRNGVSLGTAVTASDAVPSDTINILNSTGDYSARQALALGFGSKLTTAEHLALYNALHVYLQQVAGIA